MTKTQGLRKDAPTSEKNATLSVCFLVLFCVALASIALRGFRLSHQQMSPPPPLPSPPAPVDPDTVWKNLEDEIPLVRFRGHQVHHTVYGAYEDLLRRIDSKKAELFAKNSIHADISWAPKRAIDWLIEDLDNSLVLGYELCQDYPDDVPRAIVVYAAEHKIAPDAHQTEVV